MGAVCCASEDMDRRNGDLKEVLVDLPPVRWDNIGDRYKRFEASLPFNRIKVKTMIAKIDEAVLDT